MGLGMGLTMSPMSTAAMNAVDRTKAGVASGVLSMSRMVGGTFGVAVTGALLTAIGKSKINDGPAPPSVAARGRLANALGAGGVPDGSAQVVGAVHEAFVSALGTGLGIRAAVTFCGAIAAWVLIEPIAAKRSAAPAEAEQPAAADQEARPELTARLA